MAFLPLVLHACYLAVGRYTEENLGSCVQVPAPGQDPRSLCGLSTPLSVCPAPSCWPLSLGLLLPAVTPHPTLWDSHYSPSDL